MPPDWIPPDMYNLEGFNSSIPDPQYISKGKEDNVGIGSLLLGLLGMGGSDALNIFGTKIFDPLSTITGSLTSGLSDLFGVTNKQNEELFKFFPKFMKESASTQTGYTGPRASAISAAKYNAGDWRQLSGTAYDALQRTMASANTLRNQAGQQQMVAQNKYGTTAKNLMQQMRDVGGGMPVSSRSSLLKGIMEKMGEENRNLYGSSVDAVSKNEALGNQAIQGVMRDVVQPSQAMRFNTDWKEPYAVTFQNPAGAFGGLMSGYGSSLNTTNSLMGQEWLTKEMFPALETGLGAGGGNYLFKWIEDKFKKDNTVT